MQAYLATFAGAVPVAAALAVKGALWLAAIFLLTSALRSASAATRHLVWSIGIAGLFALPFLSSNLPWRIAVPLAVAPDAHRAQPLDTPGDAPTLANIDAETTVESLGNPAPVTVSDASTVLPAATQSTAPIQAGTWLVIAWYAGAVVLLLRLGRSVATVRRILANASPADDPQLASTVGALARRLGIRRHIRLVTADNITIPFTTGVLRPVIALPRGRLSWDQQKTEAVLLHELAHIARFDLWTSFGAHVACALYWFNPLIWVASRKMRVEGERACDDAVLRFGKRASDYADQLLEVVRDTKNRWAPTVTVAMARRSAFEGRLLAILSPEINRRRLTPRLATAVALGVALLT
ncbi:MAG: M56 family metallopeptidase, partial [Gemmatimonadaceae bacterium]